MEVLHVNHLVRHATLRQLQILVTVAQAGGYTRAADVLHLTQPTISMQLKKLADTVGEPLFERVGKRLHLTAVGERVLRAAEDILDRLGQLGDELDELQGQVKGRLRIAVVTTATAFIPRLLGIFLQRYPEVTPSLTVVNRARALRRLQDNEDDLVVMGQVPESMDLEAHAFLDNVLVMVAAADHPLAGRKGISLERIAREPFLVREAGSGTQQAVNRLFANRGLTPNYAMELGGAEAIKHALMAGLGVSVLSVNNVELELQAGRLAVLDVEGFPLKRAWYVVHPRGKHLSRVSRTFLDFLVREARALVDTGTEVLGNGGAIWGGERGGA